MPVQNDFDHRSLERTDHRPWPMPNGPWIMTQSWHDLLFAHWPVDPTQLAGKVPVQFPLDLYDGQAFIAVIPFHMTNVAPRGVPALPWVSAFPELNVRTYVTHDGKPGIYFFSLDATNPLAVLTARTFFRLPYYTAEMAVTSSDSWIDYRSRRRVQPSRAEFAGRYRPITSPSEPQPGTLEHFLTERYCLYTTDGSERPYRLEIHHAPWPLQIAELNITVNTMADAAGIRLPSTRPLLHFSKRQDVVAWRLKRIS
jgi:uncharacterized protein